MESQIPVRVANELGNGAPATVSEAAGANTSNVGSSPGNSGIPVENNTAGTDAMKRLEILRANQPPKPMGFQLLEIQSLPKTELFTDGGFLIDLTTEKLVIDSRGDLTLNVVSTSGDSLRTFVFQVSSACMRLASAEWSSILDKYMSIINDRFEKRLRDMPQTLESKFLEFQKNDIEAKVAKDYGCHIDEPDLEVLTLVLRICHFQHLLVPQSGVTFDGLMRIAEFCSRHGVAEALRPHLVAWARPWLPQLNKPGYEMLILAAHQFQFLDVFLRASHHLALDMCRSDEGDWATSAGASLSKLKGDILDNLVRMRSEHVKAHLDEMYFMIERVSEFEIQTSEESDAKECDEACRAMVLGSLLNGLRKLGYWPKRPDIDDVKISINDMRRGLRSINILSNPEHDFWECIYGNVFQMFPVPISLGPYYVEVIYSDTPLSRHFQNTRRYARYTEPLAWQHIGIAEWGYLPRDFEEVDSDSEDDDTFPGEGEHEDGAVEEPVEEYLDDSDCSSYETDDGDDANEVYELDEGIARLEADS